MALRRRNKGTPESKLDATPPWQTRVRDEPDATTGPFDDRDAPEDEIARVDLGALRVPVSGKEELRLEVDDDQNVQAVTLVIAQSTMQLGVFAAPRNEGIWDEVRDELAATLRQQRGEPREVGDGPFGAELHAVVPAQGGRVPVRFIGVDGPRWFLRATLAGDAATDDALARPLLDALRNTVVVRGAGPAPAREPLPLTMPTNAAGDSAGTDDAPETPADG